MLTTKPPVLHRPSTRTVLTSDGAFANASHAAQHYDVTRTGVYRWIRQQRPGWRY